MDADTRKELERLGRSRSESVRLTQRSRIVLLAATGLDNEKIGAELGITRQKAGRWRSRFAELGLEGILKEEQRSGRPPSISNRKRAAIVRKTLSRARRRRVAFRSARASWRTAYSACRVALMAK